MANFSCSCGRSYSSYSTYLIHEKQKHSKDIRQTDQQQQQPQSWQPQPHNLLVEKQTPNSINFKALSVVEKGVVSVCCKFPDSLLDPSDDIDPRVLSILQIITQNCEESNDIILFIQFIKCFIKHFKKHWAHLLLNLLMRMLKFRRGQRERTTTTTTTTTTTVTSVTKILAAILESLRSKSLGNGGEKNVEDREFCIEAIQVYYEWLSAQPEGQAAMGANG